jgi:hypothetical protein
VEVQEVEEEEVEEEEEGGGLQEARRGQAPK